MYGITQHESLIIAFIFWLFVLIPVILLNKKDKTTEGFLLADRKLGVFRGATSIAVSWVWAPAIFICSLQAYENGLAGIFWFTAPNIACFFLFVLIAKKLVQNSDGIYSFPDYIYQKFNGNKLVHLSFLITAAGYQLGAIIINAFAGGLLLNTLCGINVNTAIILMSAIALSYSLISGLQASVLTDVIQMGIILIVIFILVPLCILKSGTTSITNSLGGISGEYTNIFNSKLACLLGIPMTISLLSGPLADQMFYQRAFAAKKSALVKIFVLGGLIFGMVPIMLSLPGFIGVSLVKQGLITVSDSQMIAPLVIDYLLPKTALYAFCLAAFAGLCSTMDSALCAFSSLSAIDIYQKYFNPKADTKNIAFIARLAMLFLTLTGTAIALLEPKLMWMFFINGIIVTAAAIPVIFTVFSKTITAKTASLAIILSLVITAPISAYANITEKPTLVVLASLSSLFIGLIVCLFPKFRKLF